MTSSARAVQADIKRIIAATLSSGLVVKRIEVDRYGKIVVVTHGQDNSPSDIKDHDEWADLAET